MTTHFLTKIKVFFAVSLFGLFLFSQNALAGGSLSDGTTDIVQINISGKSIGSEHMRCNVNSDCRMGFVCVGSSGFAEENQASEYIGCCEPVIIFRQLCLVHSIIAGAFGSGVTALALISVFIAFMFGKMDWHKLLTFGVGVMLIFGSSQVVSLLTGWDYQMCELVDLSDAPGVACFNN